MRLSYNVNGLRNLDLLTAIHRVQEAGYEAIELSLHQRHLHPFFTGEEEIKKLTKELKNTKMKPVCLATGAELLLSSVKHEPSLIAPVKAGRNARISLLQEAAKMAETLEIPVVNFCSGYKSPLMSDEDADKYLIEGIWKAAIGAGNVIFAIEPEPGMFIETTQQAIALIKKAKVPNLKLNVDLGHVVCCEENVQESLTKALPFTAHIHIEDIKGRTHRHLIPGTGDIDWSMFAKCLEDAGYEGYLSVELYDYDSMADQAMKESKDFILENKILN
ncbi:sugar phosphate isomerase/epimerase family protein [Clostridium sp. KNHs205]|jgi:hydroxypyruvate isomerase|uniref:sugar phosphate isomerase/epimerase family protein n=1 Tax=Clostridium sp. KNHs205 TaxID=1449050 RepID=UPI00051AF647|nr:sugar phosphate isomerase/epimerase family protein [Clostridium sp. KNHs205]